MGLMFDLVKNGKPIKEWIEDKYSGSREFVRLEPQTRRPYDDPEDVQIRPTDFAAWRAGVASVGVNEELFKQALDLLEADPDLWISVSY